MTGDGREKAFRDALCKFLPRSLSIGSGRVFSASGSPSNQIDVVVYDNRFPVFSLGDDSLFPIESVVATVEVKSRLFEAEIRDGIEKCASVMSQNMAFVKDDADRLIESQVAAGQSREQALAELFRGLRPKSYVFGFDGYSDHRALATGVGGVLKVRCPCTDDGPLLPSVIVSGGNFCLGWGDPVVVDPPPEQRVTEYPGLPVYMSAHSQRGFGVLCCHLLWHVERRLTLVEHSLQIRRAVMPYLPFEEYLTDCVADAEWTLLCWRGPSQQRTTTEGASE